MKTVTNRGYIYILFLVLFACTIPEKSDSKSQNGDSENFCDVYYIDVLGSTPQFYEEYKTEFIVTKKIYVLDSCFGVFNEENQKKAFQYCEAKNLSDTAVNILYEIKTKHNNKVLFDAVLDNNLLAKVILDQGYSYWNKKLHKLLRIQIKWENTLDVWSLNFELDNEMQWTLFSKEYINTSYKEFKHVGFCIDTITKHINTKEIGIPQNRINFIAAFDNLTTICNHNIQDDDKYFFGNDNSILEGIHQINQQETD